jgi:hypothetical protein
MKGKQRYHCKGCGYRHTVAYKRYSEETKRRALQLYLEGLGFVYRTDSELLTRCGLSVDKTVWRKSAAYLASHRT